MDDLFDQGTTPEQNAAATERAESGNSAALAAEKTQTVPDSPVLPSQSGTGGVIREIRTLAAQPLPPLTRGEGEITTDAFGSTLRSLRERNNLTIETLSQRTLISVAYIKALEAEDYKHLPPPVYVSAYIRRLGSLYGLSAQELSRLTANVREMMAYELPSELDKTTITYEEDEENDERLRRMFWGAATAVAVLVTMAVSGIILWVAHPSHKGKTEIPVLENKTGEFHISDLISRRPPVHLQKGSLSSAGVGR